MRSLENWGEDSGNINCCFFWHSLKTNSPSFPLKVRRWNFLLGQKAYIERAFEGSFRYMSVKVRQGLALPGKTVTGWQLRAWSSSCNFKKKVTFNILLFDWFFHIYFHPRLAAPFPWCNNIFQKILHTFICESLEMMETRRGGYLTCNWCSNASMLQRSVEGLIGWVLDDF